MTSFKPKLWTTLSAAALMGVSLAACDTGGEGGEGGEPAAAVGEGGEGGAEGGAAGEAGAQEAYLAAPAESRAGLRVAHLRGFFMIAMEQTEGEEAAAILAEQGMLEVYDVNPGAFEEAGVDKAALDRAAETGTAEDLGAALATLNAAIEGSGADPRAIVEGLASIASGLYAEVVNEYGVDPIEYQHSLGMVMSAVETSRRITGDDAEEIQLEVDRLRELFPATEAPESPTPIGQVAAQASRISLLVDE